MGTCGLMAKVCSAYFSTLKKLAFVKSGGLAHTKYMHRITDSTRSTILRTIYSEEVSVFVARLCCLSVLTSL